MDVSASSDAIPGHKVLQASFCALGSPIFSVSVFSLLCFRPSVGLLLDVPNVVAFLCPSNGEKESWIFVSTIKTLLSWSPLRDTSPTKFVILLLVLINKRLKHAGPRRGVPEVAYSFFVCHWPTLLYAAV